MNNIEISKYYFELSNNSNISEIKNLFRENTTYSSSNTWLYLGVDNIIEMQYKFHSSFNKLNWFIDSIEEIRPWIMLINFTFNWIKNTWEKIIFSWKEYIVIFDKKIQHIEIK